MTCFFFESLPEKPTTNEFGDESFQVGSPLVVSSSARGWHSPALVALSDDHRHVRG